MKKAIMFLILISNYVLAQYTTPGTGVNWSLDDLVTNSAGTVTGSFPAYTINELVTVSAGDNINIQPGVTVNFTTANAGFEINGSFSAMGMDLSWITFTSPTPDSTGAYEGFRFNDSSVDSLCIMRYVRIEYAYYGIRAVDASPTIMNSILYKCRRGVQLSGSNANVIFNTIERSYEYGITMTLGSSPFIENNVLAYNNTQATSAKNQISIGLQGSNSPEIRNNTIYGGGGIRTGGISLWVSGGSNSSMAIIENNIIYDNSFGITLFSSSGGIIEAVVRGNEIYNNNVNPDAMVSGSGININGSSVNQPIISRNNIYGNWWGITIQNGTSVQAGPEPRIGNLFNADTVDDGWNIIQNNIQGSNAYDLYNNCTNDIYAHNNDWGVYDSASIEEHVYHKVDNAAHGNVFFVPFWDGIVPVELTSFTAIVTGNGIQLEWTTATETNNYGFDIERKTKNNWKVIGSIEGKGNSTDPAEYSFIDNDKLTGAVSYRLKQIDYDGTFEYSQIVEVTIENIVSDFKLEQNYPNPFNPTTKIKFTTPGNLGAGSDLSLRVYDVIGNEIATLLNGQNQPGTYEVEFDGSGLSSGIYFYKLTAGSFVQTRKMLLIK